MKKRILVAGAAAAALILGVTVVSAQRGAGRPGMGQGIGLGPRAGAGVMEQGRMGRGRMGQGRMGRGALGPEGPAPIEKLLELTGDQRGKFEDIMRGTRDASAPVADALELARNDLHRALFADTRNDSEIAKLAAKVAGLEKQVFDIHLKSRLELADILTEKQREIARGHVGLFGGPGGMRGRGRGMR